MLVFKTIVCRPHVVEHPAVPSEPREGLLSNPASDALLQPGFGPRVASTFRGTTIGMEST